MYNELGIIRKTFFVFYDSALTLKKMSKMSLNSFCDETLQIMINHS